MLRLVLREFRGAWWAVLGVAILSVGLAGEGFLWYWWATPRVIDAAKRQRMDMSRLELAINTAKTQRRQPPLDVAVIGNSAAGFAVDPDALRTEWAALGRGTAADLLWLPGGDGVGVHLLTQHLMDRGVKHVVLALSPTMTLQNADESYDIMFKYAWYLDAHHTPPELEAFGHPTPARRGDLRDMAADYWPPMRYRLLLMPLAMSAAQSATPGYGKKMARKPAPLPWFRRFRRDKFDAARARFLETDDVNDYMAAYDAGFARGRRGVQFFGEAFERAGALPRNIHWAALEAWVQLVRGANATPVLVVLPHNMLFTRPDSGAVYGRPAGQPFMDPGLFAQWREAVRAFCARNDIAMWDDFTLYPPERFYDFQHQLPESQREYTTRFAAKLAATVGADGPLAQR